jgi:hypothetical protein
MENNEGQYLQAIMKHTHNYMKVICMAATGYSAVWAETT